MTTCTFCPSPWVFCDPGDTPVISEVTDIVVLPARPVRRWCLACWRVGR
jgi:hypothetical protein